MEKSDADLNLPENKTHKREGYVSQLLRAENNLIRTITSNLKVQTKINNKKTQHEINEENLDLRSQ